MQRILTRGEIETLDRTSIPRLILPASDIFKVRAERLTTLAPDNPIKEYLELIALLSEAQQQLLEQDWDLPALDDVALAQAQAHGMPPFTVSTHQRDSVWRTMLTALVAQLLQQDALPEAIRDNLTKLAKDTADSPDIIEQQADALLAQELANIDLAHAPFIMAALQVYWTLLVTRLNSQQLPASTPYGLCPCCGSQPVSTTVQMGGPKEQIRYATCSLCATQWHIVRVKCTHCEDTKTIAYHTLSEGSEAVKAESCDVCQQYRKILYLNKEQFAEAFADDLASLTLDILMGEANYFRANNNPYFWQAAEPQQ